MQDVMYDSNGDMVMRLGAVFGVPTMTAFWLFQFFAVAYLLFEVEKTKIKWMWLLVCVSFLYPIYLTLSRSTWIACFILLFSYNLLKGRLGKIFVLLIGIASMVVVLLPNVVLRFQDVTNYLNRFELWIGYVKALNAGGLLSWLFGLGWMNLADKNSWDMYDPYVMGTAENSFLFVSAGVGITSLLLFLAIFTKIALCSWQLKGITRSSRASNFWATMPMRYRTPCTAKLPLMTERQCRSSQT